MMTPVLAKIILDESLPRVMCNPETKKMEVVHMYQYGDTFYVSQEVFEKAKEKWMVEENDR